MYRDRSYGLSQRAPAPKRVLPALLVNCVVRAYVQKCDKIIIREIKNNAAVVIYAKGPFALQRLTCIHGRS